MVNIYSQLHASIKFIIIIIIVILCHIIIDVLVALQNAYGSRCCLAVNEESGPLTVCAEILFINGTALTTSNYTVIISAYDRTTSFYSAQCK